MKKLIASFLICAACYGDDISGKLVDGLNKSTPTPMPSATPQEKPPWLTSGSTDPAFPAGTNPQTTFFVSKNRVIVTRFGDGYLITFEP